jgi:hypothetical protein
MTKKLVIAATRLKNKPTSRYKKAINTRLKRIESALNAVAERFDYCYTDLANGAPPTAETLIEDRAMLAQAQAQIVALRRALGVHDVNA